ncbi:tRNA (N1-methyl-G37)-methyltransferase [Citrifermentans bemidjiense Bem]|uniref:tRNA (guanine-N(1)-)-methyltransferase n=1 Tax=Citrifermentans bemidjiense (strain ATCC BAA-1014 / DSM 16622 / JCM 12645 / Bem) TaxID=404380 RepID=TRMD_CITBB|nr:tRNA (guanosine(37)-N1)-methyltransferase TrmD [Citrifermentans bemidjiense]B5EBC9.1 RecName: Full=tRNA (guanine-N(1)-)-methyltransferase; AltName: Full=M1G-methyltransferase; AltName: Full=tRNA [GM37] methyltransferase [Citrifermentans bemidjiense Bem]ACH40421.1 tRNA (N1-methyl-G37)-methyltransferase [Citrifermentans bemidjiense Bem]
MKFDILTLFPAMFEGPLTESILKRASDKGLIEVALHNIRDWAFDKHATADDAPYGGGAGMVMKVEPIAGAIEAVKAKNPNSKVILTTPCGRPFNHQFAEELSREEGVVIICGRYEGVDERVRTLFVDDEISLGDFVLTGGEIAAMVIVDAVSRLVPGVLGSDESAQYDSFADGLLEYPQYTRPPEFRGEKVPDILLSGNHAEIAKWRRKEQMRRTLASRPELLDGIEWSKSDKKLFVEVEKANQEKVAR